MSAAELGERLDQVGSGLVIIDMRQDPADGRPKIPGSVWATLDQGFAMPRPDRGLHYDIPTADEFAAAMSRLGATPDSEVVIADEMGNRWATRAFWLLRYFGHNGPVSVLDGGIRAYLAAGGPTAADFAEPAPASYPTPTTRDETIRATPDEIVAGLAGDELVLCDVRTPQEYSGEVALSGRGGHLPGAVNIPWETALADDGTFLQSDRLAEVLAPYLVDERKPVTYCQGGIRASLTWFALEVLLGHPARMYAASWEEWAQRPELPIEAPG
jgi:thiosulfate/3-mercaptopyruvate sulfurtransferase